jgi:hypothetical protein
VGPPSGAGEAGLAAFVIAAGLMWLGFGLTGLIPAWRDAPVVRWALAFPAIVVVALLAMAVHAASGGRLYKSPVAPAAVIALLAVLLVVRWALTRRRGARRASPGRTDLALAIATSSALAILWGTPVFRLLPLGAAGDVGLHAGWTEQLLNGQLTPSAPLTGDVPNYYPWLYHSLLALVTRLTPGEHAYLGLAGLQILQVLGVGAALFALGHAFAGRGSGVAVTLLGAATGGFGFFLLRGLNLVLDPRAEGGKRATRYLGDLLYVRSYNVSFTNLSPPYPRDVALVLLVVALFLMAKAVRTDAGVDYVSAGVVLGLVGLTQTDAFMVGVLTALLLAAFAAKGRRLRIGVAMIAPALALFCLWAIPMLVSYLRLGGFVDTTARTAVSLPLWAIAASWGLVLPLAAVGALRIGRRLDEPVPRVIVAALAAASIILATSALAPIVTGDGFNTLGRQHRYWPLLCLPCALLAGLGAHWLFVRLLARSRAAAGAIAAVVVVLALPSPLIASLALPERLHIRAFVTEALEGRPGQALNALSDYGDGECAAAAPSGTLPFNYTGFRVVFYRWDRRPANSARIRWKDIYDHIAPQADRERDNRLLSTGAATREQVEAIVRRYGLDAILVRADRANPEVYSGYPARRVLYRGEPYVLFGVGKC